MPVINLCGLDAGEIFSHISAEGFEMRHAVGISNLIYKKRMTDLSLSGRLPKRLCALIEKTAYVKILEPEAIETSSDRTEKYLFRNSGGQQFEAVFIPDGKRNTVCVSTQSGCRMGCPFCMTGKFGFHGNLQVSDILSQVLGIPHASVVTHVVFMGMGEPLDNIDNVLKAIRIMTSESGFALSPGNITVSTVGITAGVRRMLEESGSNLTLSLFSPFPDERAKVIPAEKVYPFTEILEIMKGFPLRKKRRLSIAYMMLSGVNDSDRHLAGLVKLLKGSGIRVNLLPYHPATGDNVKSAGEERLIYFKHQLVTSGISASVRKSRGADISAACGLLASTLKSTPSNYNYH